MLPGQGEGLRPLACHQVCKLLLVEERGISFVVRTEWEEQLRMSAACLQALFLLLAVAGLRTTPQPAQQLQGCHACLPAAQQSS